MKILQNSLSILVTFAFLLTSFAPSLTGAVAFAIPQTVTIGVSMVPNPSAGPETITLTNPAAFDIIIEQLAITDAAPNNLRSASDLAIAAGDSEVINVSDLNNTGGDTVTFSGTNVESIPTPEVSYAGSPAPDDIVTGSFDITTDDGVVPTPTSVTVGNGGDYATLQEGIDAVESGGTVTLVSDLSVSTKVDITKPVTIDGDSFTIMAMAPITGAVIEEQNKSDIVIFDLIIDGNGQYLHGIKAFKGDVNLNDVTIKNTGKHGLLVNSADVTVNNISTSGNAWGGIDVAQSSSSSSVPAVLTVNGVSTHNEALADVAIGDTTASVTVNDTNDQYDQTTIGNKRYYKLKAIIPECSTDDTTFDTFNLGDVDGQNGWQSTGPFDQEIVSNTYGFESFGCKSLRISNSVTSGSFGDQTFSYSTTNEAGEVDSTNDGKSGGTRQNHFEAEFDLATTMTNVQSGLALSVSPDRGDGSRMSYLSFSDTAAGIVPTFYDVQGETNPANFVPTTLPTLSRTEPHTIKFVIDYIDGPSNDVVEIFFDDVSVHTGTTWENYYRFDSEASAEQSPRTTDSLIFRASGAAMTANDGEGFLFDNVEISTGTVTPEVDPNDQNQLTLSGYKFNNINGDRSDQISYGVKDPAEVRLYDWAFNLYKENADNNNAWEFVTATTVKPANAAQNAGKYVFPQQKEAGTYHVCEVSQTGWTQVRQDWAGTPYHIITDNVSPNAATEGEYCTTVVYTDEADRSKASYFGNMFTGQDEAPTIPVLVFPADGQTLNTNDLYLDWDASTDDVTVEENIRYEYRLFLEDPELNPSAPVRYQKDYTGTTRHPEAGYAAGTPEDTYFWRVQACDESDNCSGWSPVNEFTVDNTAPDTAAPSITISSPTNGQVLGSNTLNATGTVTDPNFRYYYCYLTTDQAITYNGNPYTPGQEVGVRDSNCQTTWTPVDSDGQIGGIDMTGLPNGSYTINVVGYDTEGNNNAENPESVSFELDNSSGGSEQTSETIIVTESNLQGWVKYNDTYSIGGNTVFVVDENAPLGVGALQVETGDNNTRVGLYNENLDIDLDGVEMSYDSKQLSSDDVANGNATLRVWIDVNGDDIIDDQLMYEPYYNGFDGTSMTDWQTWAVNNSTGNFWSNYANSYNGKGGVGGGGGYPTNFTIGDVVADYPAAKIIGVSFSMGTYNDFQVVNVDNFVIETSSAMTTYDFESEEIAPAANGGGGGGAARSVSRSSGEVAGASTSNEEGEVLGDSISIKDALQNFCTPEYINNGEYMYPGVPAPLRAVLKLQMFLKLMEMINVDITGLYDAQTVAAVNMFQTKYAADILTPWNLTAPTGYVYLSTARKINELVCNEEEPSLDNLTPDPNVRNNSVN